MFVNRLETVYVKTSSDGTTNLIPMIVFMYEETVRSGLIKTTKSYTIAYNKHDRLWYGDVIDSDGWHDIPLGDVLDIVKEKNLEEMI